jgi:hypothetical protein
MATRKMGREWKSKKGDDSNGRTDLDGVDGG